MAHDFERFPELTNAQLDLYYFQSPHKQIFEPFSAKVIRVHDGDTITVRWRERDFDFPVRFSNTAAPELSEKGGKESRDWLKSILEGKVVDVVVDPDNRVEKFGRLLGLVYFNGFDVGVESVFTGHGLEWNNRLDQKLPELILPKIAGVQI